MDVQRPPMVMQTQIAARREQAAGRRIMLASIVFFILSILLALSASFSTGRQLRGSWLFIPPLLVGLFAVWGALSLYLWRGFVRNARLERLYGMLSETGKAIARIRNEPDLFNEVVNIAARYGGFELAWIGVCAPDRIRLRAKAVAGRAQKAFNKQLLQEELAKQEIVSPALPEVLELQRTVVIQNLRQRKIEDGSCFKNYLSESRVQAIAALPIYRAGKLYGALILHSRRFQLFMKDLVGLLETVAEDLSHALDSFDANAQRSRAQRQLAESELLFRTLAESTSTLVILLQNDKSIFVNRAAERVTGFPRESLMGKGLWNLVHPDWRPILRQRALSRQRGEDLPALYQALFMKQDGTPWWGLTSAAAMSYRGEAVDVITIVDISHLEAARSAAQEQAALLRIGEDLAGVGTFRWNASADQLECSQGLLKICCRDDGTAVRSLGDLLALADPEDRQRVVGKLRLLGQDSGYVNDHLRFIQADDSVKTVLLRARSLTNEQDPIEVVIGVFHDVTEAHQSRARLAYLRNHDELTGLYNRAGFLEQAGKVLTHAEATNRILGLIQVDSVRFRDINASYGTGLGDETLVLTAERLRETLHREDLIARMGADCFTMLVTLRERADLPLVIARIREAVTRPMVVDGREIRLRFHSGAACFPDDASGLVSLLERTQIALDRARVSDDETDALYDADFAAHMAKQRRIRDELEVALERSKLAVWYQPKVQIATRQVIGVEALTRWFHDELGEISPSQFIPIAERRGLIKRLGQWVLTEVFDQAKRWHQYGLNIPIAVNLSGLQLDDPNLIVDIGKMLENSGVPSCLIEFEVTESVAARDLEIGIRQLFELRKLGFKVSIDDFGTGYSSLSYLKDLPADVIKLDLSFIRALKADNSDSERVGLLLQGMISLAQALGFDVVAEGVEDEYQAQRLREFGCEKAQGFLYARPMSRVALEGYLQILQHGAQ